MKKIFVGLLCSSIACAMEGGGGDGFEFIAHHEHMDSEYVAQQKTSIMELAFLEKEEESLRGENPANEALILFMKHKVRQHILNRIVERYCTAEDKKLALQKYEKLLCDAKKSDEEVGWIMGKSEYDETLAEKAFGKIKISNKKEE